jgi:chorismate mutase-like protein
MSNCSGNHSSLAEEKDMSIEDWRAEIDEIDDHLLHLINRRALLAIRIGELKRSADLPLCDPERERQVLLRMQTSNTGPLDARAVTRLFRFIIRESRRIEADLATTNQSSIVKAVHD